MPDLTDKQKIKIAINTLKEIRLEILKLNVNSYERITIESQCKFGIKYLSDDN